MKERVKWIIIGFGFMVGIQVLTSLMFSLLLQITNQRPGTVEGNQWVLVLFGATLGSFLIGGLIMGRFEEKPRIYDALWAAILTLIFSNVLFYLLPDGTRHQFIGSKWLLDANGQFAPLWICVLQMMPALAAAALGAFLGYQITGPIDTTWERFAGFLGLVGAFASVVVAFVMGSMIIPWYLLLVLLALVIGGITYSYKTFKRGEHEVEELAILPEHRHEQPS